MLLAVAEHADTWLYVAARTEPAFRRFMQTFRATSSTGKCDRTGFEAEPALARSGSGWKMLASCLYGAGDLGMKEDNVNQYDPGRSKWLRGVPGLAVAFCFLLATSAVPRAAGACSMSPFFTPLDAEEVVEAADQILLVRATSFAPNTPTTDPRSVRFFDGNRTEEQRAKWGAIFFDVERVMKGTRSETTFSVFGRLGDRGSPRDRRPPYDSASSVASDCGALPVYEIGDHYVLFLRDGCLLDATWAAVNEEVSGPDDAWVRWVEAELEDDGCSGTAPRHSSFLGGLAIGALLMFEPVRRRRRAGRDERADHRNHGE